MDNHEYFKYQILNIISKEKPGENPSDFAIINVAKNLRDEADFYKREHEQFKSQILSILCENTAGLNFSDFEVLKLIKKLRDESVHDKKEQEDYMNELREDYNKLRNTIDEKLFRFSTRLHSGPSCPRSSTTIIENKLGKNKNANTPIPSPQRKELIVKLARLPETRLPSFLLGSAGVQFGTDLNSPTTSKQSLLNGLGLLSMEQYEKIKEKISQSQVVKRISIRQIQVRGRRILEKNKSPKKKKST